MKPPTIIYMRCVPMGKGGSVKVYTYMDFRQRITGTVYANDRISAKRKVRQLHSNIPDLEFYR